jgi:hypothetical protein
MKLFFIAIAIVACAVSCGFSILAANEEPEAGGEDSSAGLPEQYSKNYLIAAVTISQDKKFAVIYPTLGAEEAAEGANHPERIKDYIVALQPFTVLASCRRSIRTSKIRIMAASVRNGRMTARSP